MNVQLEIFLGNVKGAGRTSPAPITGPISRVARSGPDRDRTRRRVLASAPPPPPAAKPAVTKVESGGGSIGAVSFVVGKPAVIK